MLKVEYWAKALYRVYPPEKANTVLSLISDGVRVGRTHAPSQVISHNWPSSLFYRSQVGDVIATDLAAGRLLGPFPDPPFDVCIVSPLGAFPKRGSNKVRVIHDLSYPSTGSVNSLIPPEEFSFSYSSVDDAAACCRQLGGGTLYMAKLDLQDAYKHIFINFRDWHLMGFTWPDSAGIPQFYFSKVLNFGLRSAPYLFNIFAEALERFMRQDGVTRHMVRYVDDFFVVAKSPDDCQLQLDRMLATCRQAGFTVQPSKVTSPAPTVEFLGIIIDSKHSLLRISDDRLAELKEEASQWLGITRFSKRRLLRLLGKLNFAARVIRQGRAFLSSLFQVTKSARCLHHTVKLTREAKEDLKWWVECIAIHNGVSYFNPDWSINPAHFYSDSSGGSLGACAHGEWFALSFTGQLQFAEPKSINWKEFLAAVLALNTWAPQYRGRCIIFHIDNTSVCHILNSLSTPISELRQFVRIWARIVEEYSLAVAPVYISTDRNVDADDLSRGRTQSYLARNPRASPHMTWPNLSFLSTLF